MHLPRINDLFCSYILYADHMIDSQCASATYKQKDLHCFSLIPIGFMQSERNPGNQIIETPVWNTLHSAWQYSEDTAIILSPVTVIVAC